MTTPKIFIPSRNVDPVERALEDLILTIDIGDTEKQAQMEALAIEALKNDGRYKGGNIDSLMHYCAYFGHDREIALLAGLGYDINALNNNGETPLHLAHKSHNWRISAALIKLGADINKQDQHGNTPLHRCCRENQLSSALEILKSKPDPTIKNERGYTTFITALESSISTETKILQVMIDAGADINEAVDDNRTSLDLAIQKDLPGAVKLFVALGVEATLANRLGGWLNYAAICGAVKVSEMLIADGHDINHQDTSGLTPLHLAMGRNADNFSEDVVRLLMEKGADPDIKDINGLKPLDYLDSDLASFRDEYEGLLRTRLAEAINADNGLTEATPRKPRRI